MKPTTEIHALDWKEAEELEGLINNSAKSKSALVIDPERGVTGAVPSGLISSNQNLRGSDRFGRHYAA